MPSKFKDRCPSCKKLYAEHLGIIGTCAALQCALKTLEQIAATPRNRGARRNAKATLYFIKTQI